MNSVVQGNILRLFFLLVAGYTVVATGVSEARKFNEITIKVEENQNIRDISQQYLQDPDQWETLLRINGLKSPHEVKPGMFIVIPAEAAVQSREDIESLKVLIQRATKAGAKIFAPKNISSAIAHYNEALSKRKAGEFVAAVGLAKSASKHARKAIQISISNQDVSAEAVIQDMRGLVHRRKPADNVWKGVKRFDLLQEGERIRTLSQSYAEILFRDDSRLKLSENAQALIRKMRANLLENTEEATVSLVKGDVLALLSGGKKEDQFKLEVPGVDTKIKSQHFWVGRDKKGARFANYDGKLEVSSAGKKVVLSKNQGTIVPKNQKPLPPQELLPAPALLKPENGEEQFNVKTVLKWTNVARADSYMLEFSKNAIFSKTIFSDRVRNTSSKLPKQLASGVFYWRVSAVSADQLPGRPSEIRYLRVLKDDNPPFLVVRSPQDQAIFSENRIEISGITEEGADLSIMGQPIPVDPGGWFRFRQELDQGDNLISVVARDPAGNRTEIKRNVKYLAGNRINLEFSPSMMMLEQNRFLVGQKVFTLAGTTEPMSTVTVTTPTGNTPVTTSANAKGVFQINLHVPGTDQVFYMEITSLSGRVKQEQISVEIDDIPPAISFDREIPGTIRENHIVITGQVSGASRLEYNGRAIPVKDNRFQYDVQLKSGSNTLLFTAHDAVGNMAKIEKKILVDAEAPRFLRYKLSTQKSGDKKQLVLKVWAKDRTGLVKTAPYTIRIGDYTHNGHLILSGSKKEYTDQFSIPKTAVGKRKLTKIVLSDYLGNRKEYSFK